MTGKRLRSAIPLLAAALLFAAPTDAARQSKISATKHNLSASGTGSINSGEEQICVFCHTPHGADTSRTNSASNATAMGAPLWNKAFSSKSYTLYQSGSLDASNISNQQAEQPYGSSKLCLSCHDGSLALGNVRVLRGQATTITVNNAGTGGVMPSGTDGYTRQLGGANNDDLSNDHPISVTYDATLVANDREMRDVGSNQLYSYDGNDIVGLRKKGNAKATLPLEPTGGTGLGQVQCTTCHDPHYNETDLTAERNIKFLRLKRFQLNAGPTISGFNPANDIICLACHDKGAQGRGAGGGLPGGSDVTWAYSAHANSSITTYSYNNTDADAREFPQGIKVWQASCLNCHDTHTVTGAKKLLRSGAVGGTAALENTCYQCHANSITASIVTPAPPDIAKDFNRTYRMPLSLTDQGSASEKHDISTSAGCAAYISVEDPSNTKGCGADLFEPPTNLSTNRHVECTDCHNPHRVVKNKRFDGESGNGSVATPGSYGRHEHDEASASFVHTNVASGALRGIWGVEPNYSSNSFHASANTITYTVRRGDPGSDYLASGTEVSPNMSAMDTKGFVTREYQVCLKCHSNYRYGSTPPALDGSGTNGRTASATNGLLNYTNQAQEFQAPLSHANEPASVGADGGANAGNTAAYNSNNHRSWHPVMRPTGRTLAKRGITQAAGTAPNTYPFRYPWATTGTAKVGVQTMYCSDCHGSDPGSGVYSSAPASGNAYGPHGSSNPFLLRGTWTKDTGKTATQTTGLCFKCHDYNTYAKGKTYDNQGCNGNNKPGKTGFGDGGDDLHCLHNERVGKPKDQQCAWCHVAVPHGWKNKALLANLNDVGEEVGHTGSKEVAISSNGTYYTKPPYYNYAKLKIASFAASGAWTAGNCGSSGKSGTSLITESQSGTTIDAGRGAANSNTTGTGKNWMTSTCSNPTN